MARFLRWTLVLVLLPALAHAQSTAISLDEAVELFKQNSLQEELARYDRLRKKGEAIRYQAFPNPEISVNREALNAGTIDYWETSYTLSQPLPLLGQPFLRSRSASNSREAADLQFEYDRRRLIGQVKTLYARYWELSQKLDIYNRALEVVRKARESAAQRQAEGTYSGLRVQRFNVELNRYRKQRDRVRLDLRQTGNRLANFLYAGEDPGRTIEISDSLTVTPIRVQEEVLLRYALANRADLKALEKLTNASELRYKVEKRNRLPDLHLNVGYKNQSDGAEGLVIGGSIKVPVFDRNRGNVAIAGAEARSRENELALNRREVRNQVETAYQRVEMLMQQWNSVRQDMMGASMLEAAQAAYREGRYSLVELLDATRAYVDGQTMTLETIAEYNIALFELDVRSGGRISETQGNS